MWPVHEMGAITCWTYATMRANALHELQGGVKHRSLKLQTNFSNEKLLNLP